MLDLIADAGCMQHVILVGSWAEFVYKETGLLAGFSPSIKTLDVDFLIRNLRRPVPPARLSSLARERGFIVESDILNGTSRFFDPSGLEVEFLIGKIGAGEELSLKTNVGVTAQAIRHLNILSGNAVEVFYGGHIVQVPNPEAYAVHKMVINSQRGRKAEKDARAIIGLWQYLDRSRLGTVLAGLTKKERLRAEEFMRNHGLALS